MNIFFQDGEIDKYTRDHVCARCYGELQKFPAPERKWGVKCPNCGEAWGGTVVRRSTAERRGQSGLAEIREVKTNLPDIFPNPNKGRTTKDILEDLGF